MRKHGRLILLTLLVLVTLCAAGALLAYRWVYANFLVPPGEGPKAAVGYAACQPVIDALAAYHQASGSYPPSLEQLPPTSLAAIPPAFQQIGAEYSRTETGYSLAFSYAGPGINRCVYTPEKGWDCSGFY